MAVSKKSAWRGVASTLSYLANSLRSQREQKERQAASTAALFQKQQDEERELANRQSADALNALRETPEGQHQLFQRAGLASPGVESLRNRQFLDDVLRYQKDNPELQAEAAKRAGIPENVANIFGYSPLAQAKVDTEKERANRLKQQQETDRFNAANKTALAKMNLDLMKKRSKRLDQDIEKNRNKLTFDDLDNALDHYENYGQSLLDQLKAMYDDPALTTYNEATGAYELRPEAKRLEGELKLELGIVNRKQKAYNEARLNKAYPNGATGSDVATGQNSARAGYGGEGPPPPAGVPAAPFTQGNEITIGGRRYRRNQLGQYEEVQGASGSVGSPAGAFAAPAPIAPMAASPTAAPTTPKRVEEDAQTEADSLRAVTEELAQLLALMKAEKAAAPPTERTNEDVFGTGNINPRDRYVRPEPPLLDIPNLSRGMFVPPTTSARSSSAAARNPMSGLSDEELLRIISK